MSTQVPDTFINSQGPLLYMSHNRLPASDDIKQILIYIVFSTLFVSLIVVIPGIRKRKMTTFTNFSTAILIGATILLALNGSAWHVGNLDINAPYSSLTMSKISGKVGVKIGLSSVNVTLVGKLFSPDHQLEGVGTIDFNEQFTWNQPDQMDQEFTQALKRGLPYPILTVAEYLSQDSDGFIWGRQYRLAGYYTSIILWFSFITWIIMLITMSEISSYFPYLMQTTGLLMLLAVTSYSYLIPSGMSQGGWPMAISFENVALKCKFGNNYWQTLIVAVLAIVVGSITMTYQMIHRESFGEDIKEKYSCSSNSSTMTLIADNQRKPSIAQTIISVGDINLV